MKFRNEIICDFTHLHIALNTIAFAGHSVIGHVVMYASMNAVPADVLLCAGYK